MRLSEAAVERKRSVAGSFLLNDAVDSYVFVASNTRNVSEE